MDRLAFATAPLTDEGGELAVATQVAVDLDLREQGLDRAPVLPGAQGIGFERQLQRCMKRREFARRLLPAVRELRRLALFGFPEPPAYRVAR